MQHSRLMKIQGKPAPIGTGPFGARGGTRTRPVTFSTDCPAMFIAACVCFVLYIVGYSWATGQMPGPSRLADVNPINRERMNIMSTTHTQLLDDCQGSLEERIGQQLRRMNIPGKLKGHCYLTEAISQVTKDPERLEYVTKGLYLDIAKIYKTKAHRVERAMRHAIKRCWEKGGREALEEIAGFQLQRRPTNSDFIDLVASYFRS